MTLYEDLKWRGLIKDETSDEIKDKLNNSKVTFYWGTDPTAPSLHLGHFSSLLTAKRLADYGHKPILLIGGATGLIGDPRPTQERSMIDKETVINNIEGITKQVTKLFGYEVVNNYDWAKDINFIDFLRDYGKYFNINYMLDKDIIRRRLDTGITFTEFSYMLMQAMDFEYLYKTKGCTMQVSGSDQWGNITAGVDLIRKKDNTMAYAFTMPLVTTKDGTKFGKSEGNALWLDNNMTSSYELYQYLINVEDELVISYLKIFTFLSHEEINALEQSNNDEPHLRKAHQALAKEVITFLHGEDEYNKALRISQVLFSGKVNELSVAELEDAFKGVTTFNINEDINIVDLLVKSLICNSKREAREFVLSNTITINGEIVNDLNRIISKDNAISNKYTIIRKGKKKYFVIIHE